MGYTTTLLILNIAVFLLQFALGSIAIDWLGFTPSLALSRPWTFITAMFLHAGLLHILFNMFALLSFGPLLEYKLGSNRFLALYLAGGVLGNIGYWLTALNSTVPGIGASGAIFTILGALAVLEPNLVVFVGFLPLPMYIAAVFWLLTEFFLLGIPDSIARGAHLAGLVAGLIYGYYHKHRPLQSDRRYIGGPF